MKLSISPINFSCRQSPDRSRNYASYYEDNQDSNTVDEINKLGIQVTSKTTSMNHCNTMYNKLSNVHVAGSTATVKFDAYQSNYQSHYQSGYSDQNQSLHINWTCSAAGLVVSHSLKW